MARYQSNRASCGPAALSNALAALGVERSEDELIKLTGQTTDGAGVKGMLKALRAISNEAHKLVGSAVKYTRADMAEVGLWYNVSDQGRPFILCVDDIDHWVACTGHLGDRYCVIDSADTRLVLYYDAPGLLKRWEYEGAYYGIIV